MGQPRSLLLFFNFLKTFRRCPLSKRTLVIFSACVLYLIFVHGNSPRESSNKRAHNDKYRRGLNHAGVSSEALPVGVDADTGGLVAPTRSNVVYITLKSKRIKPANIRGTVRPKLRRKVRKETFLDFTHDALGTLQRDANQTYVALHKDFMNITTYDTDNDISTVRIYSQKPPPWFTANDVNSMRFLADAKVLSVSRVPQSSVLIFEGEPRDAPASSPKQRAERRGGVIHSPVDSIEVFAYHLDRVLGLNRTLPAVSRKFRFLHDGQPCPVVLWDPSALSSVKMTWGQYQNSLKLKCWTKNISPKSNSGCSPVHHHEWSKMALFDFLLQIHSRVDPGCCGFRPRVQDVCLEVDCSSADLTRLNLEQSKENPLLFTNNKENPRLLQFTNNKGYFDRNEDNLDFRILQGITQLPAQAVSVLHSGRLRGRLLQSLFMDQTYWESQGGRGGIEKLIDVIERRAKVLLTYINAHGITLTNMHT